MFTKILFSVVVLLDLNFMTIWQPLEGKVRHAELGEYSTMIRMYPEILNGTTEFCKSGDVLLWVGICRQVLKKIREFETYKFLYLDYQFFDIFDHETASQKCNEKRVAIPFQHTEVLRNLKSTMKHRMATCPSRDTIVPKHKTIRNSDYTQTIAITPDPKKIDSVLVFIKNSNDDKYSLLHYFQHLRKYKALPHPDIYTLPAPTYTYKSKDLAEMYLNLQAVLTNSSNGTQSNIVDRSDRFYFARLCLMTNRVRNYEQNILDVGKLCDEKPAAFAWKVSKPYKNILADHQLLVYPCSPPEMFVPPDSINSEIVKTRKNELLQLYALSRGPDDNSLVLLRYDYNVKFELMSLVITKFIENVYEIFLREIHIPNGFEERCQRPRRNLLF